MAPFWCRAGWCVPTIASQNEIAAGIAWSGSRMPCAMDSILPVSFERVLFLCR